jgi:hypothetical protein
MRGAFNGHQADSPWPSHHTPGNSFGRVAAKRRYSSERMRTASGARLVRANPTPTFRGLPVRRVRLEQAIRQLPPTFAEHHRATPCQCR